MSVRDRIVEVLAKYNVHLQDAPLDALTMAMERMIAEWSNDDPMPLDDHWTK